MDVEEDEGAWLQKAEELVGGDLHNENPFDLSEKPAPYELRPTTSDVRELVHLLPVFDKRRVPPILLPPAALLRVYEISVLHPNPSPLDEEGRENTHDEAGLLLELRRDARRNPALETPNTRIAETNDGAGV